MEYARGGMVRHGYAVGGHPEDEGFLGDLGSMFGADQEVPPVVEQQNIRQPAMTQEQPMDFGGLFGGEQPAAPQRAPSVTVAPQEGGLFDFLGGEEAPAQRAAPVAQPAREEPGLFDTLFGVTPAEAEEAPRQAPKVERAPVATDRQSRGLLDDLFGGDEEAPAAAPVKPVAPKAADKKQAPIATTPTEKVEPTIAATPETAPAEKGKETAPAATKEIEKEEPQTFEDTKSYKDLAKKRDYLYSLQSQVTTNVQQRALEKELDRTDKEMERSYNHWKDQRTYEQGKVGVIGKDEFGRAVYGYTSGPKLGQRVQSSDQKEVPPRPAEKHYEKGADGRRYDEKFLESLDPGMANEIVQMAKGNSAIPVANSRNRETLNALYRYAPDAKQGDFKVRTAMRTDYDAKANPTGAGGQIIAANTALGHLRDLSRTVGDLNNSGFKGWNYLKHNVAGSLMGDPAMRDFELNKKLALTEIAKAYKGGPPGEHEARDLQDQLSAANTPEELQRVIAKAAHMMSSKTNELGRKWQNTMGDEELPYPVISPESKDSLKEIEQYYKSVSGKNYRPMNVEEAPASKAVEIPSVDKREVGKTYTNANGVKARWTEHGWERM
jgi:hypothetical protein